MKKNNKGFTLVELIVVLVILAILAAILVPALLGYIDRAKESKDMFKARNMLQATQTVLSKYYGNGDDPTEGRTNNYDVSTAFAKEVRATADDDPYLCIIGVGNEADSDTTEHDKYTAYFVIYWETKDDDPLFFNGKEWGLDYPWPKGKSGPANNYFTIDGERKCLKFIFVSNNTKQSNPWVHIQNTIDKNKRNYNKGKTTKTGK